eukprot:snap_masked-scaffold_5-processed-gene-12.16-mRNA-1 protein AED:0.57 eAED:1.00 QI:0/-1/0/1/-1/1/1/0/138
MELNNSSENAVRNVAYRRGNGRNLRLSLASVASSVRFPFFPPVQSVRLSQNENNLQETYDNYINEDAIKATNQLGLPGAINPKDVEDELQKRKHELEMAKLELRMKQTHIKHLRIVIMFVIFANVFLLSFLVYTEAIL